MKEISNKVLMYVLFVAVVVSVGSMMYTFGAISKTTSPTGMVTSGTVDVTISDTYVLDLTDYAIDYGTGSLNSTAGDDNCLLESNGTQPTCWESADWASDTMTFENVGGNNIDINVTGTNATAFIGGDAPVFTGTCYCASGSGLADFTIDANGQAMAQECCEDLTAGSPDTGTFSTKLTVTTGSAGDTANLLFTAHPVN